MNKEPKFTWDGQLATCTIYDKNKEFVGTAICHPEDAEFASEKTGCEIAYARAALKLFAHQRDNVILPSLKALQQLKYSMKHSKNFNSKSYENKMLNRQILNWESDLQTIKKMIKTEREFLNEYIKNKEELYQKLREYRKGQKEEIANK